MSLRHAQHHFGEESFNLSSAISFIDFSGILGFSLALKKNQKNVGSFALQSSLPPHTHSLHNDTLRKKYGV